MCKYAEFEFASDQREIHWPPDVVESDQTIAAVCGQPELFDNISYLHIFSPDTPYLFKTTCYQSFALIHHKISLGFISNVVYQQTFGLRDKMTTYQQKQKKNWSACRCYEPDYTVAVDFRTYLGLKQHIQSSKRGYLGNGRWNVGRIFMEVDPPSSLVRRAQAMKINTDHPKGHLRRVISSKNKLCVSCKHKTRAWDTTTCSWPHPLIKKYN